MNSINNSLTYLLTSAVIGFLLGACRSESWNMGEPIPNLQPAEVTVCEMEEEPALFNERLVTFEAEAHALTKGRVELWSIEPCPYEKMRSEPSTLPEMDADEFEGMNLYMILDEGRKVVNIRVMGVAKSVSDTRSTMYGSRPFKHVNIDPLAIKQISETRDKEIPIFPPPVQ